MTSIEEEARRMGRRGFLGYTGTQPVVGVLSIARKKVIRQILF